jgi:hypothetical protein
MGALLNPTLDNFVQKTLGAQMLAGATVATLNNVTSIQNLPGAAIIDRVDTNNVETPTAREVISFTGTSGVTLVGVVKNADGSGTDAVHAVGAIVEFGPDILWAQSVIDGLSQVVVASTGLLDTTKIVDKTTVQVLTNKTLTTPTLTSPVINTGVSGTAIDTDGTLAANSDTVIASQKAVKTYVGANGAPVSGWTPITGTFTYASASTINVSSGAAAIYGKGDRIKWLEGATQKYGVIAVVADTLLTIAVNTDYVVTSTTLTSPNYSHQENPIGYPHWFAYTPTGPTNTTLTGRFALSGRIVACKINGAVTGTPAFTNMPTLPITASANMPANDANNRSLPCGVGGYLKNSTANRISGISPVVYASGTVCQLLDSDTAGNQQYVSATVPVTWANTDNWFVWFEYET